MNTFFLFVFFKQKTAYEMRISDWSSDVCSSDLRGLKQHQFGFRIERVREDAEATLDRFACQMMPAGVEGQPQLAIDERDPARLERRLDPTRQPLGKADRATPLPRAREPFGRHEDRKSTRLNSSH